MEDNLTPDNKLRNDDRVQYNPDEFKIHGDSFHPVTAIDNPLPDLGDPTHIEE